MLRLPPIEIAGLTLRLPLSDASAAQLAEAFLLAGEQGIRDASLDPAVSLWILLHAARGTAELATAWEELAGFIENHMNDPHRPPPASGESEPPGEAWNQAAQQALPSPIPPIKAAPGNEAPINPLADFVAHAAANLCTAFSHLETLQHRLDDEVQQQKLHAMRELAYGASHEINNPLANISTRAQTLLRDEHDPERRRALATINSQAFRAHEMIANLMLFAKPPQLDRQPSDLAELIDRALDEMRPQADEQSTHLRFDPPPTHVTAPVDGGQLIVAIKSLVRNSLEALKSGGCVEISLAERGDVVELTVSDNGPGVPEKVRPRMFDPFYSSREAGRGLGFGLSWAWRIVTLHGGRIALESPPETGATFRISLPLGDRPKP